MARPLERGRGGLALCVFDARDQVCLGEGGDRFVHAAPTSQAGYLDDQWRRDDFVVFAAHFDLVIVQPGYDGGAGAPTAVRTRQSSLVR